MSINAKYVIFQIFFCFCIAIPGLPRAEWIDAREMFSILPDSIFENTPEGLPEAEKQQLLSNGESDFWEIVHESPEEMLIEALPFRDKSMGLRLFRNPADGSTTVAIGTMGEPVCSLELWRRDSSGRLVPVDTPPEPETGEFFTKKHKLPAQVKSSVQICLGRDGLVATPLFWNQDGMLPAHLENEVLFNWNGSGFEKKIVRIRNAGR